MHISVNVTSYSRSWLLTDFRCASLPTGCESFATPQINPHDALTPTQEHVRAAGDLSRSLCTVPAEVERGDTLPSCLSSHPVNQQFPWTLQGPHFSHFYAFVGVSLSKMDCKCDAEVPSSVPKGNEAGDVPYRENLCVSSVPCRHEL